MNIWIYDPKTEKKSVTLTLLVVGFCVATAKLALSSLAITDIWTFEMFSGIDYATVVGSLGALYWGRKMTESKGNEEDGI